MLIMVAIRKGNDLVMGTCDLGTNVKRNISTTWTVTSFVPNTWNYAKILPILDDNSNPILQGRMASNMIKFFMPKENSQVCHPVINSRNTTVVRGKKTLQFLDSFSF